MADVQLYYFDEHGYSSQRSVWKAGATTLPPPSDIPAGSVAQWNPDGTGWQIVDAPPPASAASSSADSSVVDFDALAKALQYDPVTGNLTQVTAGPDAYGNTYVQTLTYTGGALTGVTVWVKQ